MPLVPCTCANPYLKGETSAPGPCPAMSPLHEACTGVPPKKVPICVGLSVRRGGRGRLCGGTLPPPRMPSNAAAAAATLAIEGVAVIAWTACVTLAARVTWSGLGRG